MSDCEGCKVKTKQIIMLSEQCENHHHNLHTEKKRTVELSNALQAIHEIARDKMWYPCSFEDHEAVEADQKKYTGETVPE